MSLIIKDHIRKMFVGYPTKAQNYNVAGGILSGSVPAHFGDIVCFDGNGFYRPWENGDALADIAGLIIATNVKQAEGFATNVVQVNPGEGFNLALYDTFMAVEIAVDDVDTAASEILPKGKVYVNATTGALEDATVGSAAGIELTGVILTGNYEIIDNKVIAEIYIK